MNKMQLPLSKGEIGKLKAGEQILLSGIIYTARDQAHKRMCASILKKTKLPVDIKGAVIYYCGPTPAPLQTRKKTLKKFVTGPAPKGKPIGACGPTTSKRMDKFTPALLAKGLSAMIGKGNRSKKIIDAIKRYKAVYFLAPAGAGAYLALKVKKAKPVAYQDLGPEAIYKLEVKDFPVIVGIDSKGRNIYEK